LLKKTGKTKKRVFKNAYAGWNRVTGEYANLYANPKNLIRNEGRMREDEANAC
jgi:hypothetical protein